MRGRGRLAALALVACLAVVLPAGVASARGRSFWGVEYTNPTSSRDFRLMHRAHVGTVRIPLWHSVVSSSGWSPYDRIVGGLANRRIRVLPDLVNNPGDYTPPISGGARTAWTQFAHDAVNRYGPGGSFWRAHPRLPRVPIRAWQVGNEPNLQKYFPSSHPVRDYATLLKITHSAIRGANRHAKVVLAGMPALRSQFVKFPGVRFLARLYRVRGIKRAFDIAATHPYAENMRQLRRAMTRIRSVMRRHGDKRTRVWITELGYGSAPFNHHLNFGRRGQARMLHKTFGLVHRKRRAWKIKGVVWYDWRDPAQRNPDCSFCSTAGLLKSDFHPKPSYRAFKRLAR
jgi:polysaccharide biosynthesis protein PslG